MSQTLTDLDLDKILSADKTEKSPAPWSRDEDDQLLRELYALLGDVQKEPERPAPKPVEQKAPERPAPKPVERKAPEPPAAKPVERKAPEPPPQPEKPKPAPQPEKPKPAPKPAPEPEKPKPAPEPAPQPLTEPDEPDYFAPPRVRADEEEADELPTERSAPGWLKGTFLFLISLLLCGMTLYAVAVDVLGPLF